MPSALPIGDPSPSDGSLPASALTGLGDRPFGVYVHVPFCATRCGYCDFNTYTAGELGTSASPESWLEGLRRELDLAATVLGGFAAWGVGDVLAERRTWRHHRTGADDAGGSGARGVRAAEQARAHRTVHHTRPEGRTK